MSEHVRDTSDGNFENDVLKSDRPVLVAEDGRWIADYVRLRFRATLPG